MANFFRVFFQKKCFFAVWANIFPIFVPQLEMISLNLHFINKSRHATARHSRLPITGSQATKIKTTTLYWHYGAVLDQPERAAKRPIRFR
ncbi:MAG: hypothetical protein J6X70_00230, partial [Muribaculaceae bacterium]|nr:hypothetical protein [Muribaculaceae bacterium]